MIQIRPSVERGHFDHGWLDTRHTFSFGHYHDPLWSGYSHLLVLNEDRVLPGQGFGMHGHRDMEILSWVLEGAISHQDSLGNGDTLRPGSMQRMSAGTGIRHSEFNPSPQDPLHFLQIWIVPQATGVEPSWEQKDFTPAQLFGKFCAVATPTGKNGSVQVGQDVTMSVARLAAGQKLSVPLDVNRKAWIQIARGQVNLNGHELLPGDGAALDQESSLELATHEASEILWFDLP